MKRTRRAEITPEELANLTKTSESKKIKSFDTIILNLANSLASDLSMDTTNEPEYLTNIKSTSPDKQPFRHICYIHSHDIDICRIYECSGIKTMRAKNNIKSNILNPAPYIS